MAAVVVRPSTDTRLDSALRAAQAALPWLRPPDARGGAPARRAPPPAAAGGSTVVVGASARRAMFAAFSDLVATAVAAASPHGLDDELERAAVLVDKARRRCVALRRAQCAFWARRWRCATLRPTPPCRAHSGGCSSAPLRGAVAHCHVSAAVIARGSAPLRWYRSSDALVSLAQCCAPGVTTPDTRANSVLATAVTASQDECAPQAPLSLSASIPLRSPKP